MYLHFINRSKKEAIKEKKEEIKIERKEALERKYADTINGNYIPENLHQAFLELDKLQPTKIKN